MTVEQIIGQYGYLAVLFGTFLEGEIILLLGGLAAKLGHLSFSGVVLAAFTGSLIGDQLCFFLGRRYGRAFIDKRPGWRSKTIRLEQLLDRWGSFLVLSFRFLYGLRTVASFVFGMGGIPVTRFIILNAIGAAVWALSIAGLGYLFGHATEVLYGELDHFRYALFGIVAAGGLVIWCTYSLRARKRIQLLKMNSAADSAIK